MIYRVVLDDTYDLHTSDINCMLLNPSIELEMNAAGSFNFTLPPTHPYWDRIEILKSTIDVYEDDDLIFTGRVANIDKNWNNEREVECEGALAYFNDSIHRQNKWENPLPIAVDPDDQPEDPAEHKQNFLEDILNNHNVFVGNATNRQIHMGHIYVDPYLVTREVDYDTTLDILTRMCIDTNGGYFMIRKDPETHLLYLDWLKDFTEESGQPASFGVNLLDFNTGLHAADICTGVLARGATVNDQVVTLSNVELVDKDTYPDMSVDHYTDRYQDILWHREGVEKFGQVVQVHEFPDAQTDWKNGGQVVANSLFEEARKWLEEKNTKVESIEVEVAELSWLQEGVPKYKLGQIVEILDDAHMAGESYEVRRLPMYKLSCDLSSGSKKVTLGRPPKKELTQISASNSDSSTLSSGNSSGSSSGGGSGSGEECKVHDVRVDGTSVVSNKIANISLTGKADTSVVNALAATVATKADASSVTALANVVAGKQDQIEFNTAEAATEVLTRLKADDVVYNLGGGTEVVANPSETATDDLETIKIGNTVYDISGGSTNYGKFKCDVLFNTPTTTSAWANPIEICSEEKAKEYDMIYLITRFIDGTSDGFISNSYLVNSIGQSSDDDWMMGIRSNSAWNNPEGFIYLSFDDSKLKFYTNTGKSSTLYKVYGLKFENKLINRSDIYSEEERIIGRWTDGKLLYQKTYRNMAVNLSASTWTNTSISITNFDHWEVIFNKSLSGGYDNQYPMLYRIYNGYFQAFCQYAIYLDELTIQYTKTTDQPGSGFLPEDPQMVMMSDYYSEDEQVVGRWTDGKPVYQKTYKNIQLTNSSDVTVDSDFGDKTVVKYQCISTGEENGVRYITPVQSLNTYNDYAWPRQIGSNLKIIVNRDWRGYTCDLTIQYTKTTDAPGTGPTKGNLIYLPALYSEEEREVGVWTDGKPLYQKTVEWSSVPNGRVDGLAHNIQDVEHIHITEWIYDNSIVGHESSDQYYWAQIFLVNAIGIYYRFGPGWGSNLPLTVTFQYTKTTDQPGSGKYLPDGQLAHHYSTSEKVVGTWIDGSTLYERTITGFSVTLQSGSVRDTGVDISYVSKLISVNALGNDDISVLPVAGYKINNTLQMIGYQTGNVINCAIIQYTKSS